jgi:hypothetical protein
MATTTQMSQRLASDHAGTTRPARDKTIALVTASSAAWATAAARSPVGNRRAGTRELSRGYQRERLVDRSEPLLRECDVAIRQRGGGPDAASPSVGLAPYDR